MLLQFSRILTSLFCLSCFSSSSFANETVLLLIRHGETSWNAEGRTQGHIDVPLNEKGHGQAKELAEKMSFTHSDIAAIYSSDLTRAYATASKTAELLNLPISVRPSLREYKWGSAEGMPAKEREQLFAEKNNELKLAYPNWKERWDFTPVPESETMNQLLQRFTSELLQIAKSHPGEKIAVFTHGRAIRSFLISLFDSEDVPDLENCEYVQISCSSDQPFSFVKTEHLAPD